MRKKMYWGIGTLIILILGVTAVLLLRDKDIEPEVIYKTDVEPARKTETPIAEKPTARPGFKMVQHGDHWHEVPISDTGKEEPVVTDKEGDNVVPVENSSATYKNNGKYVDIDYSVFDNPRELIRRHAEVLLNPEKYSIEEVDRAAQESLYFNTEMRKRFGTGEYYFEIKEYRNKVFLDPYLKKHGSSVAEIKAQVRGEIPPKLFPVGSLVLPDLDGGDK